MQCLSIKGRNVTAVNCKVHFLTVFHVNSFSDELYNSGVLQHFLPFHCCKQFVIKSSLFGMLLLVYIPSTGHFSFFFSSSPTSALAPRLSLSFCLSIVTVLVYLSLKYQKNTLSYYGNFLAMLLQMLPLKIANDLTLF